MTVIDNVRHTCDCELAQLCCVRVYMKQQLNCGLRHNTLVLRTCELAHSPVSRFLSSFPVLFPPKPERWCCSVKHEGCAGGA